MAKSEFTYTPPEPVNFLYYFKKCLEQFGELFTYKQVRKAIMLGHCPFVLPRGTSAAFDKKRKSKAWITMSLYYLTLHDEIGMWVRKEMMRIVKNFFKKGDA